MKIRDFFKPLPGAFFMKNYGLKTEPSKLKIISIYYQNNKPYN